MIDEETYAEIQAEYVPYEGYAEADPHDAAFVVYTSGSTGRPKGVLHEMGNVDLCLTLYPEQEDYEELHTCFTAPFYAVASILLAINCMCVARTTYIVSEQMLRDIKGLHKFLVEHEIADTFLPPSFVRLYPNLSPYLRDVLMGGEPADGIYYESGTPKLLNYYSMTEAGFPLLVMPVTRKYDKTPVGAPVVPGIDLHLEDEEGNRIEGPGEGEICFKNFYVRGYVNLPEMTKERFRDGIVHTGDIARRDEYGLYTIVGRADDMFKINGNRIEPSEIEAACRKVLGLSWCAAKGFEKEEIVALFYTDPDPIDEDYAREELGRILPYYMIPTYFIHIDKAPVSPTGKVIRSQLTLPEEDRRAEYAAPRNEFEQVLAAAMAEVLEIERIGIRDDFFKLGGNSLRAMEVLEKAGIENLNVNMLYQGRTIEAISELYEKETETGMSDQEKEAAGRSMRIPLGFQQKRIWLGMNNGTQDFIIAYRLSPLVSLKKLRDALNAYAEQNSTFHLVIENDDGVPVQVYSEQAPQYEIESMSEHEVQELQKTFIAPFEYGEPLIRIRLIKTLIHKYLFFQMSHIVSDGSGVRLFLQDLTKLYQGEPIRPSYYFAWAYDAAKPIPEYMDRAAEEYYRTKLDTKNRMRNMITDTTGLLGQQVAGEFGLPLDRIEALVSKYNSTNAAFIHLTALLAMEHYNRGEPSFIHTFLENRSPNENSAGMHMSIGAIGITARTGILKDLFQDMNEQQVNVIRYAYYNYAAHNPIPNDASSFLVSYVSDWFIQDDSKLSLGEAIPLENQHITTKPRPILYLRIQHQNGKMMFQFQYDRKHMTDEHAKEFMSMMQYAGFALLEDRLPVWTERTADWD